MSEAAAGNTVGEAVREGGAAGPLFLVGVPRSGTTLLYKLLCLPPGCGIHLQLDADRARRADPGTRQPAHATLRGHPQDHLVRR